MERQYVFAVGFKIPDKPHQVFRDDRMLEQSWKKEWDLFSVSAEKRFEANKEVKRVAENYVTRKYLDAEIAFKKLLEVNEI